MAKNYKFTITPDNIHLVGQELKTLREKEQVSQGEMAKKLDIDQANVSYHENKRTGPSLHPLTTMLNALGYELVIVKK